MRQVGAGHAAQRAQLGLRALAAGKVGSAAGAAAFDDVFGDGQKLGMDGDGHGGDVPCGLGDGAAWLCHRL
ncbi:hypothetical protein D3C72_1841600 [compost metagenome]